MEATFVVDGGGLFWRSARLPESQREATRLKAELIAEAYALSGIDAVALGPSDLALGWAEVKGILTQRELPVLAANLACDGASPFPATRVVERGGVKLGFIGSYVGVVPPEATACTADDPVATTVAGLADLGPVDVVVALGAWDAKQAEALVAAAPAIDFVVSGANLTLPDGRALTQDDWMLGAGSRGKKIGLLQATLVPGGKGWQGASPGASEAAQLDSFRKRLASNKERLASATDEKRKQQAERQIAYYEKEVARLEAALAVSTAARQIPANTFTNKLDNLSAGVADHPATAELVAKTRAVLKEKGLDAPEEPVHERVELAPGLPGPRVLEPGEKPRRLPVELKAQRLGEGAPVPPTKPDAGAEPVGKGDKQ
jgi:2',3'-cyclic-nucleotide 2'-phosphodiesterase (5'-nucleotidase family)